MIPLLSVLCNMCVLQFLPACRDIHHVDCHSRRCSRCGVHHKLCCGGHHCTAPVPNVFLPKCWHHHCCWHLQHSHNRSWSGSQCLYLVQSKRHQQPVKHKYY